LKAQTHKTALGGIVLLKLTRQTGSIAWPLRQLSYLCSVPTDAPIINCTESRRTRATPGQRVTFACSIRANPSCDDVTWTYAVGDDMDHDLHTDPNIRIDYKVLCAQSIRSYFSLKRRFWTCKSLQLGNERR